MIIGIIGLGLIGGSLAKALNKKHSVLGCDIRADVIARAIDDNAIEGELKMSELKSCDMCIIALYPQAAEDFLREHSDDFRESCIVCDCIGVKKEICALGAELSRGRGFVFVGGHPMAGREFSGYGASSGELFDGASMLLVPVDERGEELRDTLSEIFCGAGFSSVIFTTADEHDRIIAFTSQLAHIVSSAYIRSPEATEHRGFSAGSYKDMTRVAYLNEEMWTQLFLRNPENLCREIEGLAQRLLQYSEAIRSGSTERLCSLLRDGRERKIIVDGGTE